MLGSVEQRGDVRTKGDVMQHHRDETAVDGERERIERRTALDANERKQAHDLTAHERAGIEPSETRFYSVRHYRLTVRVQWSRLDHGARRHHVRDKLRGHERATFRRNDTRVNAHALSLF